MGKVTISNDKAIEYVQQAFASWESAFRSGDEDNLMWIEAHEACEMAIDALKAQDDTQH